jgi:hypothetical protein
MRLGIIVVFFHMVGHVIILVSHAATPSHPKFKVHFFNNLLRSVLVKDLRPLLKGKCTENPWSNPNLLYIIMGEDDFAFSRLNFQLNIDEVLKLESWFISCRLHCCLTLIVNNNPSSTVNLIFS